MGSNKIMFRFLVGGFVVMLCLYCTAPVYAQTWNDWVRQKKTQERYLLKQIAYLKLYANQAWKGYQLVDDGLETVRKFSSGEWKLHEAFITGLSRVSPLVRDDHRLVEVVQCQLDMVAGFGVLLKSAAAAQDPNLDDYRAVRQGIMTECTADLDELLAIVLGEGLEMSDAQRLVRLQKVYRSMVDKASFVRWFCGEAMVLVQHQRKGWSDLENLRRIYGKD